MSITKFNSAKLILTFLMAALLMITLPAQRAHAATFDLTGSCPGGVGDVAALVTAIDDANSNGQADTITLADNCVYTLTSVDNSSSGGDNGLPVITSQITIDGNGSTIQRSAGASPFRIFYASDSGDLTLNDLTIQGGEADWGAGIRNGAGTLTLNRTTIRNNNVSIFGGGIANLDGTVIATGCHINDNTSGNASAGLYSEGGSVSLTDCTISGNTAARDGAGIRSYSHLNITNSTLSDNHANDRGHGGAINIAAGNVQITNSTFSGNTGSTAGAIYYFTDSSTPTSLSLTNVTMSGNSSGIYLEANEVVPLRNSIIAGNTDFDCEPVFGTFSSQGYNLVGVSGGCPSGGTGDQTTMDPLLGPLADNGGPTLTRALLTGSPALDVIPPAQCAVSEDQRGVARPQNGNCDVGAFEYNQPLLVISTVPANGATLATGPTQLSVTFNRDVKNDGSSGAANNTQNYLLVEDGSNGVLDTNTCAGGVVGDDTRITVNSAVYSTATRTATLSANNGTPLPAGTYYLFVCGTTSIEDLNGNELNNGTSDTRVTFTVSAPVTTLPATGFAPGHVTLLPPQPAEKAYANTDIVLEIPTLGKKMAIVGVPRSSDGWDVTWLGDNAGWLAGSAFPTWTGNTVLTGHVWDAYNQPGPFAGLKSLKYGDQIKINAWGQVYTYEVRESRLVSPRSVNTVLRHEELDWVTLLSCEFYNPLSGNYLFRRMVRAVLVSVK